MNIALETGLGVEIFKGLNSIFSVTPEVEEVVVFGSRAKGNFSEGSDIDLAVKGKGITLSTILDLMVRIDMLGLLYKVDIQNYNRIANKELIDHINRVGKTVWKRVH
jgi:predicted nucleotidyltransferase